MSLPDINPGATAEEWASIEKHYVNPFVGEDASWDVFYEKGEVDALWDEYASLWARLKNEKPVFTPSEMALAYSNMTEDQFGIYQRRLMNFISSDVQHWRLSELFRLKELHDTTDVKLNLNEWSVVVRFMEKFRNGDEKREDYDPKLRQAAQIYWDVISRAGKFEEVSLNEWFKNREVASDTSMGNE